MSKRFVCCVIDMVLVALVAELIFMGLLQITRSTPAYTDATTTINEEIEYYERLTEQTHVVEYVEGVRVATDVIVLKNLCRAICLSYQVFGNNQQPDFSFDASHDVMKGGVHSPENDNVAYFYTRYLKNDPPISVKAEDDLFAIYKKAFGDDAQFMFTFNKEVSELPVLNTQVAYYLFHYLFIDSSDSIGQTGATYYESYYNSYSNMLEEAEMLVLNSEPYYSTRYLRYRQAYCAEARYVNITLTVSIILACLIVLLIPKYLFGDGRTVGYRLLGLGVLRTDGSRIEWYIPLVKTLVAAVGFIPIAFILYLFPPFSGGYEALFVPATVESGISLALVLLIITVVGGIVNAFGLFTSKRQNLINLIFDDLVLDSNRPDEGEEESVRQGRDY